MRAVWLVILVAAVYGVIAAIGHIAADDSPPYENCQDVEVLVEEREGRRIIVSPFPDREVCVLPASQYLILLAKLAIAERDAIGDPGSNIVDGVLAEAENRSRLQSVDDILPD